ncbi:MAG TPA: FHA domain-containing protein, partial [Candidatus Eisenbacteria bacterium]|nr:FHA domain-containing protein [Candidatus Eisenbacteria bacterium]
MQARLICPAGKLKGRTLSIVNEAVVGRSGSGITIPDDRVSSKHARIYWVERDGCFYIEDLGSTNGTNVAGRRISGPERLEPMDVVNFGGAGDFVFQVVAPPLRPETPSSVETQLDQSMTLPPLEPETNVLDPHAPIVLPPRLGDADRT